MNVRHLDALVVGAGFGGIYQLKKLRDQGLSVAAIDAAGGVGGTWYWNRYPGAMSDTEAYLYRYSWDLEDLRTYPWTHHYLQGPDILAYLTHIVKSCDLSKDILLNTELRAATWDDRGRRWTVETSSEGTFEVRYLVMALGLLSKVNLPDIPGISKFEGEMHHTARWPDSTSVKGKRVGVIGNGSTGIQVLTAIAKEAKHLVSFQRNPQYSVPSGNKPVSPDYRKYVNKNYEAIWREAKDESLFGFGFQEVSRSTFSVSPEKREQIYEAAWRKGGGFRFMFETFGDVTTDEAANNSAADFIKRKIASTVKDPEKARKLMPTQLYARRPLCDAGYYEEMNRDHVEVVSLLESPITTITADGIVTSDGKEYKLDVIVLATGFDAVDGNYTRIRIKGRDGHSLKDHWRPRGPSTSLGMCVPGFPNLFMITGPCGPFSNIPPAIETCVESISKMIADAEKIISVRSMSSDDDASTSTASSNTDRWERREYSADLRENNGPVIGATPQSEADWLELCEKLSAGSLFRKTDSWIFGVNVEGKKRSVLFYFGGLSAYRKVLREVVASGYQCFQAF